jgi:alpha-tubulin suppressor-like RCC1 family protein
MRAVIGGLAGFVLATLGTAGAGAAGAHDGAAPHAPAGAFEVWTQVSSAQDGSACGIQVDGTLWCWGDNHFGQLGLGDTHARHVPVQVGDDANWAIVNVGASDTCAIKTDGSLWCWGWNLHGQLGQGDQTDRQVPTQVGSSYDWASVSLGNWFACATKVDGTLWCWGRNFGGDLGFPGGDAYVPTQVGSDSDWLEVHGGDAATCGIRTDHTLWCWGDNSYGQLGLGDTESRSAPTQVGADGEWATVAEGYLFDSCATRLDGSLWCWGGNLYGGLGVGDTERRLTPTQVGWDTDWASVSPNGGHTCALKTGGSLWCWGRNDSGELGLGDRAQRLTPQQVGSAAGWSASWSGVSTGGHDSCATQADDSLWCWGSSAQGELGVGNRTDDTTVPVQVGPPNRRLPIAYRLSAVTTLSPDDAWAVGYTTQGRTTRTLTEHWDGSAWSVVASPSPGGRHLSQLTSVTAVGPDDVWAVGIFNTHPSQYFHDRTLTMHWDGTSWSRVPSPNGHGFYDNVLQSVSAVRSDDVWAVGYFFYDEELPPRTLAVHWDGTSWTRVHTENPDAPGYLDAVAAVRSTNVWAVGRHGLLEHYNGTGWKATRVSFALAAAISASSRADIWVVGGQSSYLFDGSRWVTAVVPDIGDLTGVSTLDRTEAVAVGGGNAIEWDGSHWTQVATPGAGSLAGVSLDSATDGWAVGYDGRHALLEHWNGTAFTSAPSPRAATPRCHPAPPPCARIRRPA